MKESKFIQERKEDWAEFEKLSKAKQKDPDLISNLFVQITNDLSHARTFYRNRSVRLYLNNLAQKIFHDIYKNKKIQKNRFLNFWKNELPLLVFDSRKELLLSLLVFVLAFSIGVFSSINDPDFCRTILGDQYVDMTIANIENDDPMAVYKSQNQIDMFLGISLNNLWVSFITFIFGIVASIGSVGILLINGIMIGSFQYFFIEKGLFWESFLTVWLHGTIEVSCIILAGAAGIVLGKGLIFPGTLSRVQSFQFSAVRGLKLFIGIVPLIVLAALIESFITRYTEVHEVLKGGIILASLAFVGIYFVWYPWKKSLETGTREFEDVELPKKQELETQPDGMIRNNSEIFRDTFLLYRMNFLKILKYAVGLAALYMVAIYFILSDDLIFQIDFEAATYQQGLALVFDYERFPYLGLVHTILFSGVIHLAYWILTQTYRLEKNTGFKAIFRKHYFKSFLLAVSYNLFFYLPIAFPEGLLFLFYLFGFTFLFPVLITAVFISIKENRDLLSAVQRARRLIVSGFWKLQGLLLLFGILGFVVFLFLNSPVSLHRFYSDIIQWNLSLDGETLQYFIAVTNTFVSMVFAQVIFPLFIIVISLLYYSLAERMDAKHLKQQIENF